MQIEPPRLRRGSSQVIRSQLALELALNAYAVVGAAMVIRVLLLVLRVDDRLWIGATAYRFTDPLVWPLTLLPGADREVIGAATLPDFTLLALLALIPLGLAARGGRSNAER